MNEITLEQLEKIRRVVKKYLSKEAAERISRIRLVKPNLALEFELNVFQLIQEGKIKGLVDDETAKKILEMLSKK